jgi:hypothetical protein
VTGTSPSDIVTVLGAFPALEELRLKLVPAAAAEVGEGPHAIFSYTLLDRFHSDACGQVPVLVWVGCCL